MIIECGNRRLVSYRYGWRIEVKTEVREGPNAGKVRWVEDRPAYPANLTQACEVLCERALTDNPDMTISQLPDALKRAASAVRRYMESARASV